VGSAVAGKPQVDGLIMGPEPHPGRRVSGPVKGNSMASSEYYRRQSELCLQLALLQADLTADLRVTFLMLELAKELRAKASEADNNTPPAAPAYVTCVLSYDTKLH
jgi:hypothetical protein